MANPLIAGRYSVLSQLSASGAGGEVYEVHDTFEDEVVVLKFMRTTPLNNPWQEAQLLRRLSDPHILPIRNADLASGIPFVVTERATHGTLETKLTATRGLGLDANETIQWMRQASFGVARAHDMQLVHNDIKPANIFLNVQGEALVGDFGGAALIPSGSTTTTPFQATPDTVAPEIAAGWGTNLASASFASDVYSLGATTFWLLTGTTPHDFGTATGHAARCRIVVSDPARRLRDVAPHVPQSLATVVERALEIDPNLRFASALEFAAALSSRRLPDRLWHRTNVHASHIGCWEGSPTATAGAYLLCIEGGSRPSKCLITTIHVKSGNRVSRGCKTVPMRNWPQSVRGIMNDLS